MSRLNRPESVLGVFLVLILIPLLLLSNLEVLLYEPTLTPEAWLEIQPWFSFTIFSTSIILVQPTSTIFVFALGILSVSSGVSLLRRNDFQHSRKWWSIALILWGLGALFAGTSYQAFSYELKCGGREFCLWTSWLEVYYMILTVASVNAMMVAQGYSCIHETKRKVLFYYAITNFILYTCTATLGSIIPVRFLITFELMLLFLLPNILMFFFLNSWRVYKQRQSENRMDKALVIVWIALGIIMGSYFLYLSLDITSVLWDQGIWFSENDILHIGLILWIIYIRGIVSRYVIDLRES